MVTKNITTSHSAIIEPLSELSSFSSLLSCLKTAKTPVLSTGVIDSQKCHLIYATLANVSSSGLVVTHSELAAKQIFEDLQFFLGDNVLYYPSKDILFYNADVHSIEIKMERFKTINSLILGEGKTVVLSAEALLDRLLPLDTFDKFILNLSVADTITTDELLQQLVLMGYERRDVVEGAGQFAVRGGIVDVFTPLYKAAVRIELWGDEIDSIRIVDVLSQRSTDKLETIRIFPMRELVYEEEEIKNAVKLIEKDLDASLKAYTKKGLTEEAENLEKTVRETLEKLIEQKSVRGIDAYFNYFYEHSVSILDYMPKNSVIFFDEPSRISEHIKTTTDELAESIKGRMSKGFMLPRQAGVVFPYQEIVSKAHSRKTVLFTTLTHSVKDFTVKEVISFDVHSTGVFNNQINLFIDDLKFWRDNEYRILILAGGEVRGQRLSEEITEHGLTAVYYDNLTGVKLKPGQIAITSGSLNKGFQYKHINFAVITGKEIFGLAKKRKPTKKKKGAKIESFTDLKVGDYVVHDNHGIGIYRGIEQIVRDDISRDYLKISYADGGVLYISTSQMDMLQKYIGSDGAKIKLNKMGGAEWEKAKARTKAAVKIVASELIELYAERQASKGFAFGEDTVWQREFEDMFRFEETTDQLNAIEDVKRDMESVRVMDRLICGDVGYGKTEVAIRAAFKAVQDGKQVAYLVPTTILAQQHYNTFTERMSGFPVTIELMSRFRTKKQQSDSIERLNSGAADIVIGTHRILSKDVQFKDLGLVIIDEEQRFGVAHKEKLKHFKKDVDVLTLTATPIPRTLNMSMTGIRDMSILEEPPDERQPIQTYVMEYNPEFVREAIMRELSRGGQVYYLHNRVRNISDIAHRISQLVPEASVSYAHGKMSEHELERAMLEFIEGTVNVLVCTTIIETGLDISNVNTIIIQDADYFGLSQLYQLRGRVGRSNRLAYAYLMYRKDKVLDETAEKRLQTIRDFTEFGSGFKIAMRDLEIRGAGNLLGGEQHGHMDVVGYDMYCRLLADAIKELRGEETTPEFETTIDVNVNAFIPSFYIQNEEQKLEIYKKVAGIGDTKDYFDVQEEIEDRFGNIPKSVQMLLEIALLKAYAHKIDITEIKQKNGNIVFTFKPDANVSVDNIFKATEQSRGRLKFVTKGAPSLVYKQGDDEPIDFWKLKELLSVI